MGQQTSKTETTVGAKLPGPSGFCLYLVLLLIPDTFVKNEPSKISLVQGTPVPSSFLKWRKPLSYHPGEWVSVPITDTSHSRRPCLLQVT